MRRVSVTERTNLYRKEHEKEAIVWQQAGQRESEGEAEDEDRQTDTELQVRVSVSRLTPRPPHPAPFTRHRQGGASGPLWAVFPPFSIATSSEPK